MILDQDSARMMARQNPERLLGILRDSSTDSSDLFFAAESAGDLNEPEAVQLLLRLLLKHPSDFVREGAVYGLAMHVSNELVRDALQRAASSDKSDAVRFAAAGALDVE